MRISSAFAWIESELGAVHVLVSNAGILRYGTITGEQSNVTDLRDTLQTNLWGSVQCTRKAVETMKRQKVIGAHVILINSICGHKVVAPFGGFGTYPTFNVYTVAKFGITALGQVLQQEFNADGLKYKVPVSCFGCSYDQPNILIYKLFRITEHQSGIGEDGDFQR